MLATEAIPNVFGDLSEHLRPIIATAEPIYRFSISYAAFYRFLSAFEFVRSRNWTFGPSVLLFYQCWPRYDHQFGRVNLVEPKSKLITMDFNITR